MRPFEYARASDVAGALALGAGGGTYYAGGTNLIDLMKIEVAAPRVVVDINALPLAGIERRGEMLHLGALARLSDTADDATVATSVPAIAQALAASASGQLRNMATLGGNVLQRTRCWYFRDVATPCNKRVPGSGCGARAGESTENALLGTSDACIATHASDFAVPLAAFDATLRIAGQAVERDVPVGRFFLTPGRTPERETALERGELIVRIDVPLTAAAARSTYVKVRDRSSYAFALASCAAGIEVGGDGTIADVRIALGGVGTTPVRAYASEDALRGRAPSPEAFAVAAKLAFAEARPTVQNAYKIDLGIAAIVRALETVSA